jgi:DNA-binding response OmpR family regulator
MTQQQIRPGNPMPGQDPGRILVVDDEPDIRSGLIDILSLEGYNAQAAGSGREALNLLEQWPYQVMILDMRMPDIDGLAVIDIVRQDHPDLLIIVLTGHATLDSAIAAAKTETVIDYILKPARDERVIEAVKRALQKCKERARQQQLQTATNQLLEIMSQPDYLSTAPAGSFTSALALSPSEGMTSPRFISVSSLTLDCQKRQVLIKRRSSAVTVKLTKGETAILTSLMSRPDQALSCKELVRDAWGYEADGQEAKNIVRPHILRLRQKLEVDPKEPCLICTIRNYGYRFCGVAGS